MADSVTDAARALRQELRTKLPITIRDSAAFDSTEVPVGLSVDVIRSLIRDTPIAPPCPSLYPARA